MTTVVRAKDKLSRRLNLNLWGNDALKKNYPPGQHGKRGYRKRTNYGEQLCAKQAFQFYYNLREKHLRKFYKEALRASGDTIENFVGSLERRLDMVVYRLNLAPSIFAARQLVSHKHVLVNGHKINIGSYLVKPGDVIELVDSAKEMAITIDTVKKLNRRIPSYLTFEPEHFRGTFVRVPNFQDVPYPAQMQPNLVIEFYSR